jgi:hypothetical protein
MLNTPVSVIVPCVWHVELDAVLTSLLRQVHDDMYCICVTETETEPAAEVICALQQCFPRCVHVVAGRSQVCGQKNWNLLAGLAQARALQARVIVCCDDDNYPPDEAWLTGFLRKCAAHPGYAWYTAFHAAALPAPVTFARVLHLFATRFQHVGILLWRNAVWAGAMAFELDTFDRLAIAKLWATTVVDDMSLVARLSARRERARYVSGFDLKDVARIQSLHAVVCWLRRQLQYVWFYLPRAYAAILLLSLISVAAFAWLLVRYPVSVGIYAVVGPLVVRGLCAPGLLRLRRVQEATAVVLCLPAITVVVTYAVVSCLCTRVVKWKRRHYRLDGKGRVVDISDDAPHDSRGRDEGMTGMAGVDAQP